jgi:WD40 repeat protein
MAVPTLGKLPFPVRQDTHFQHFNGSLKLNSMRLSVPLFVALMVIALSIRTKGQEPSHSWLTIEKNHGVREATLTRNAELLATGDLEGVISIWRASDGSRIQRIAAHADGIIGLQFSPDGTQLASISRDTNLKLWSTTNWSNLLTKTNVAARFGTKAALAFSPDNALLVVGLEGVSNLGILRVADFELLNRVQGHSNGVNAAAFSPDGKVFVTGGGFRGLDTTVRIWDAGTQTLLKTIRTLNTYGIDDVVISPDGKFLVTGTDHLENFAGNVQVWNTANWTLHHTLPTKGHILSFSPDNRWLLSVGPRNEVNVWSTKDWRLLSRYTLSTSEYGNIRALSFGADSRMHYLAGERFDGEAFNGHVAALKAPFALALSRGQNNTVELDWLDGSGQLQMRTNWTTGWITVSDVPATFQTIYPAAVFRLRSR